MEQYNKVGHGMLLEVCGTPYEQGVQQGRMASELIKKNVVRFQQSFQRLPIEEKTYAKFLAQNLRFIEAAEPAMLEEMKGLSDGSGIDFQDIVNINLPLYFVFKWLPQECSSILARGKATLDGKTYLIKNRDMGSEKVDHVILRRKYNDDKCIIEVNGAGIITFPGNGINEHGLAISTSGVWSNRMVFDKNKFDKAHALLNSHLILERCRTVDEAISYLEQEKRMSGMNFVIADREKAAAVEVTADRVCVIPDEDGLIVRSNHYLAPELVHLNRTPDEYSSTYKRYERAMHFLQQKYGKIQFQDMLAIASDHENGYQDSLCRHGAAENASTTVYSSIIVLEDFQVWTSLSNMCEAIRLSTI